MNTVRLLGELGNQFGREHTFAIASPAEAIRALCANFRGFDQALIKAQSEGVGYRVLADETPLGLDDLHHPTGRQTITIVPEITGAGGNGLGQILLGAAIIAVAWWNPMGWAASGAFLSQATLYSLGVGMALGGVSQMLAPVPKLPGPMERPENQPSYTFNGPVNTSAQGQPVPVGYGRMIVGSAVISAGIDVDQISA